VLRIMFGNMREKAKEGWRKLHNKKLYNFRSSQITCYGYEGDKVDQAEMSGTCKEHSRDEKCM
jgi:hypothetical protein